MNEKKLTDIIVSTIEHSDEKKYYPQKDKLINTLKNYYNLKGNKKFNDDFRSILIEDVKKCLACELENTLIKKVKEFHSCKSAAYNQCSSLAVKIKLGAIGTFAGMILSLNFGAAYGLLAVAGAYLIGKSLKKANRLLSKVDKEELNLIKSKTWLGHNIQSVLAMNNTELENYLNSNKELIKNYLNP